MIQLPPHLAYLDKRRQHLHHSLRYSASGWEYMDVWKDKSQTHEDAPVLLWIPGGGWAVGSRWTMQGHALMDYLVKMGWICLSIDYRTAPLNRWPAPLEDVEAAIGWARRNVGYYGGNPDHIVACGASAGGHLATLAGIAGLVDGVVSLYGSYDWKDRSTPWRQFFMTYLEAFVVGKRSSANPEAFISGSPMEQVKRNPMRVPTMMVHGTRDNLIPIDEARRFHSVLSEFSEEEVRYLELPVGHGFDLSDPVYCKVAIKAIAEFLTDHLCSFADDGLPSDVSQGT